MNQLTLEQKQAISMAEKGLSIKMLAFAGGGKKTEQTWALFGI